MTCQPARILNTRQVLQQDTLIPQVMVQWQGKSAQNATWEDRLTNQDQFPDFNLEDKVALKREGIVRNQSKSMQVYYVYRKSGRNIKL